MIVFASSSIVLVVEHVRSKNTCHFETTIHIPIMFKKNPVKKLDLSCNLHLSTDFVVKEASFINLESSSHPARKTRPQI